MRMEQQADMPYDEAEQIEALRESLAQGVSRWTAGVNQFATVIPNLTFYRSEMPTQLTSCMVEPSVAIVVQGAKRMLLGGDAYAYDGRRFLITSLDLPVMMQVVGASPEKPYLGMVLKLDLRQMAELMVQSSLLPPREQQDDRGMILSQTTPQLLDAFMRLLKLLDEPDAAISVLAPLIQREIYYRLLVSDQGMRLWQIASVGSQSHRIARAIDWLKSRYAQPLRIDKLASLVQMSTSSFHHHFRLLTAMSPLQFQKWLRLNEARRLMLTEQLDASTAAFQVGYESPSQFSREYSRLFGVPPLRDLKRMQPDLPRPWQ